MRFDADDRQGAYILGPKYKFSIRRFWICLIAGFAVAPVSYLILFIFKFLLPDNGAPSTAQIVFGLGRSGHIRVP